MLYPFTKAGKDTYYASSELAQRINLIQHLIQNSEQLLLILAEAGCGKTALLYQVTKQVNEHWWVYQINASSALSPDSLLSGILTAFNVKAEGKETATLQENLRSHIAATRYNSQLPVLIVDDAHLLPLPTLKAVVDLALSGEMQTRMRVILSCEPQITSILATPEFEIVHDTLIHTLDVPRLSKAQIYEYIKEYLYSTPYGHMRPFTDEVLQTIYDESAGVPAEINLLAEQVLHRYINQYQPAQATAPSASGQSRRLGLVTLLAMTLLAAGGILYLQYPELFRSPSELPSVPYEKLYEAENDYSRPSLEPLPTPTFPQDDVGSSVYPPTHTTTIEEPVTTQPIETETIPPVVNVAPPVIEKIEKAVEPSQTTTVSQPTDANLLDSKVLYHHAWLEKQQATHYTIQLLGAHDLLNLKSFLAAHQLTEIALFKTRYNGKAWFVLLQGSYAKREQAEQVIKSFSPELLAVTRPWIRTFSGIQSQLNTQP